MSFNHLEEGTSEDAWVSGGAVDLPALSADAIAGPGSVLVLAAHPDDEALGAASLLAHCLDSGREVSVLLFTAGENSHPHSPTHSQNRLKQIRLSEFDDALSFLNRSVTSRFFSIPDGSLSEHSDFVRDEIMKAAKAASSRGPLTIVAPLHNDGHTDHDTLGAIALETGRHCRGVVLEYPIWYWHWASPADQQWQAWRRLPDPRHLDRDLLFNCYRSQVLPLSAQVGDEAILGASQLAHARRGADTFAVTDCRDVSAPNLAASVTTASDGEVSGERDNGVLSGGRTNDAVSAATVFDMVHTDRVDPWSVRSSTYEIDKRTTLLRNLPRSSYEHIVEIGCSIGVLSEHLADHTQQVTAIDASRTALRGARLLHSAAPNINFVEATVPFDWPEGLFDCVVLSETGFYLSQPQLRRTLERIADSTMPQFDLVLCHWTGPIRDWPLDARKVHEMCLSFWPDHRIVHHTDGEYLLDILTVSKDGRDVEASVER